MVISCKHQWFNQTLLLRENQRKSYCKMEQWPPCILILQGLIPRIIVRLRHPLTLKFSSKYHRSRDLKINRRSKGLWVRHQVLQTWKLQVNLAILFNYQKFQAIKREVSVLEETLQVTTFRYLIIKIALIHLTRQRNIAPINKTLNF